MKTVVNIIKIFIISILLGVGMLAILGDLTEGTTYWWIIFIIIKISGVIMVGVAIYLTAHWKEFNPVVEIDDDGNRIEDDEEMK